MEATIRTGSDVTTLVNVFTVEPDNQQKLVQLLKEGTEAFFSKQPGFISSIVHASKEGRRAINVPAMGKRRGHREFSPGSAICAVHPEPCGAVEGRDDPVRGRRGQSRLICNGESEGGGLPREPPRQAPSLFETTARAGGAS